MPFPFRFGISPGNRRPFRELARDCQLAESLGFDSAWVTDHLLASNDENTPYFESWTLIASLAMLTNRLRFGVMVSSNTFRNPGLLAKEAVTIDHASNGRVEIGIGTGWMEREHTAYSIPLPPIGERIEMLKESIEIIKRLMTEERTTYHGRFYQFEHAPFEPKPLQKPCIPIVIGAFRPRMLALAGRYADTWNTRGEPDEVAERAEIVRAAAREAGRDPADIRFSVFTWQHPFTSETYFRQLVLDYIRAGCTDFIFPMPPPEYRPVFERCAREVIPELRRLG
jgi:alkanesulfonate monooxygenase SsuD/methylene tetrahydromethanopterin reductase-like flavin-dependent oxidoreductase (luciferase family)